MAHVIAWGTLDYLGHQPLGKDLTPLSNQPATHKSFHLDNLMSGVMLLELRVMAMSEVLD